MLLLLIQRFFNFYTCFSAIFYSFSYSKHHISHLWDSNKYHTIPYHELCFLFTHINEVLVCFHDFIVGNILRGLVVLCRVSASLQALPSYNQNTAASQKLSKQYTSCSCSPPLGVDLAAIMNDMLATYTPEVVIQSASPPPRSAERRVGKGCRSRASPYT